MKNMQLVRESWEAMERENTRLLRKMTIEEGARAFLSLCEWGEPHLIATEELFRPDREAYLTELQETLRKFGIWWQKRNGTISESL